MKSEVYSESLTIGQTDILYIAQQINLDLVALSRSYPEKLPYEKAAELFNSYPTFLMTTAITQLGFSLYDPADDNRVYVEHRYELLYGSDMPNLSPDGRLAGKGGRPIERLFLPPSAKFNFWVVWSPRMLSLSFPEQEAVVAGTGWSIPSQGELFEGRYEGGAWNKLNVSSRQYLRV